MSKKNHPLSQEFDIEGTPFSDEYDDEVVVPSDREEQNLELVIEYALNDYAENKSDMALVDPKNRIKIMEINEKLLNTAKDARYKLERLRIEREKMNRTEVAGSAGKGSEEKTDGSEEGSSGGVSRSELMERARKLKAVN